ncbi:MAG: putative manganese transporter [Raoultibacter sp.]
MEFILHILEHSLLDTVRLVPFLFVTYLAMEALEHKAGNKAEAAIRKAGAAGPAIGGVLGAFPQCGFSAAAATLYAGRVITLGTLFAVFLSTSDEMLPIFIAEQVDPMVILKILGAKVIIGMIMGFLIDAGMRIARRSRDNSMHIHELCEQEKCHCHDDEGGILRSAIKHTLQVTLFIFIITLALEAIIEGIGEDVLAEFLAANPGLSVFASALVGLIPNCAASVVITELYIEGTIAAGAMMAGLLVSAGVGLLVLFRTNRKLKQNLAILAGLYVTGVVWGLIITVLGITF